MNQVTFTGAPTWISSLTRDYSTKLERVLKSIRLSHQKLSKRIIVLISKLNTAIHYTNHRVFILGKNKLARLCEEQDFLVSSKLNGVLLLSNGFAGLSTLTPTLLRVKTKNFKPACALI